MLGTIGALLRGAGRMLTPLVHGQHTVVLQPYRGYGSEREVFLMGRVFRQAGPREPPSQGEIGALAGLFFRDGVGGAILKARLGEREQQGAADLKSTTEVTRTSPAETAGAVEKGELGKAIEAETGAESVPNMVVRPEHEEAADRIAEPSFGQSGHDS